MGRSVEVILFVSVVIFLVFAVVFTPINSGKNMFGYASSPLYSGYAVPINGIIVDNNLSFASSTDSVLKTIDASDDIIYRRAYISYDGQAWTPFNITPTSTLSGDWIYGRGISNILFSPSILHLNNSRNFTNNTYIIIYSCSKNITIHNWSCHDGWQIIPINAKLNAASLIAPTVVVYASSYDADNIPANIIDGNLNTRWSAYGIGEWIQFNFSTPQTFNQLSVAVYSGDVRFTYFNISISNNGIIWTNIYSGKNSGTTSNFENYSFSTVTASYMRIVGMGSNLSLWNSYSDVTWTKTSQNVTTCTSSCLNKQCGSDGCSGTCGTCSNSHGTTLCSTSGICQPSCSSGYANCDSNNVNGCETPLGTMSNCASCSNICSSGQACSNNVCTTTQTAYCGDGTCNNGETCSNCSGDCGACSTNYLHAFYVSYTTGSDTTGDGSITKPWKTISHVNSQSFQPGDAILFKRGDTWQETLIPSSSGSSSAPITYGAYGTGNKPIITAKGSIPGWNTAWTNLGSNRWSKSVNNIPRIRIWWNGVERMRSETASVTASTPWYFADNVLTVYSTGDPSTTFSSMEMTGVLSYALSIASKNYVTLQNLDFRSGAWDCITMDSSNYVIFDNCSIGMDAPCYGLITQNSKYGEVKNCLFDTGDRFMDLWQAENSEDGLHLNAGSSYWLVHNNEFDDWGHSTIYLWGDDASNPLIGNKIYNNYLSGKDIDYGRAFNVDGIIGGMTGNEIYNNYAYSFAVNSQFDSDNLKFYNNIINGVRGTVSKDQLVAFGIAVGAYGEFQAQNLQFYHNTIVNCAAAGISIASFGDQFRVQGNIFTDNILAYNGKDNHGYQIYLQDIPGQVNAQIFRNNLLYSPGVTALVYYGHDTVDNYPHSVAEFNAESGTAGDVITNNLVGDPVFVDLTNSNFHIGAGSAAIDKGIDVGLTNDYDGKTVNNPPDIGAYEYP